MKLCFFVCLFFFATVVIATAPFTRKTPEDVARFVNECFAKLNIPNELQEKLLNSEYPDNELTHKHIRCMAEKFGTWNKFYGYIPELLLAQFGQDKKGIIEKCLTYYNPIWTIEKWTWSNWKCLSENGITTS